MKKIVLIVGHSESKQGAVNESSGVTEFVFNDNLAQMVYQRLLCSGLDVEVVYRESTYSALPSQVNKTGADIAVSLHCNAFDDDPHGSETLFYKGSTQGVLLATSIQEEVVKCLELPDRGVKPKSWDYVGKAGDKGGYLLRGTAMPCVIVEPFFIDSDSSLALATKKINSLADAYCAGIKKYINIDL